MVVMHVAGLTLDERTKAPILILKSETGETILPIWIGATEAMAISVALNSVSVPRPLTHDLLLNTLNAAGGSLLSVEIVTLRDGTYYAELDIQAGKSRRRVDCRPSDAVALALRADSPILVHNQVLEAALRDRLRPSEAGPAQLSEPADAAAEMLRHTPSYDSAMDDESLAELLKSLEPDTKIKM